MHVLKAMCALAASSQSYVATLRKVK